MEAEVRKDVRVKVKIDQVTLVAANDDDTDNSGCSWRGTIWYRYYSEDKNIPDSRSHMSMELKGSNLIPHLEDTIRKNLLTIRIK